MLITFSQHEQDLIRHTRMELQAAGIKPSDSNVRNALAEVMSAWGPTPIETPEEFGFRGVVVTVLIKFAHMKRLN